MKEEDEILLATSIAMELAKGLDGKQLCELIGMVNQISCSLSGLLNFKNLKKTNQK